MLIYNTLFKFNTFKLFNNLLRLSFYKTFLNPNFYNINYINISIKQFIKKNYFKLF